MRVMNLRLTFKGWFYTQGLKAPKGSLLYKLFMWHLGRRLDKERAAPQ